MTLNPTPTGLRTLTWLLICTMASVLVRRFL